MNLNNPVCFAIGVDFPEFKEYWGDGVCGGVGDLRMTLRRWLENV